MLHINYQPDAWVKLSNLWQCWPNGDSDSSISNLFSRYGAQWSFGTNVKLIRISISCLEFIHSPSSSSSSPLDVLVYCNICVVCGGGTYRKPYKCYQQIQYWDSNRIWNVCQIWHSVISWGERSRESFAQHTTKAHTNTFSSKRFCFARVGVR